MRWHGSRARAFPSIGLLTAKQFTNAVADTTPHARTVNNPAQHRRASANRMPVAVPGR